MVEKWHIWKFKYIRICTDLVCVIVGVVIFVIAGHEIKEVPTIAGIGTIITAFFMGPLIDFFNNKIAIPFLNRGKKENSSAEEKPSEE